jgi:ABC-2 type transport system ATP-binding protein
MLAVEAIDLCKSFTKYRSVLDRIRGRGEKVEALKDVSLEVKKGETFGLLGPNGAGKTTFMNIISTLLLPDSGTAKVFGLDVVEQPVEVRKIISVSSAYSGFYDELTLTENLKHFAMLYGLKVDVGRFISMVGLDEYKDKVFDEVSSGTKQKAIIAKSLMSTPRLLLLDELTVALDPNVAFKIRNLIKSWKRKNKTTVILATHNMQEAEELCNRIAIIHNGEIVACDTPSKLKKIVSEEDCVEILVDKPTDPSRFLLKIDGVKRVAFKDFLVTLHVDEAEKRLEKIIKTLISKNYHIKTIKVREPSLEDVFIKLTGVGLE